MACARGQSSVEYVAVVALVAIVLGLAAAAAGPTTIGRRVVAQVTRALCVVRGGQCDADRLPCPTGWRRDQRGLKGTIFVIRLGEGTLVIREERSDGSVAMTLGRSTELGLELEGKIDVGLLEAGARGALLAAGGSGRTWILPGRAAADRFERVLADWKRGEGGHDPNLPPPNVTYEERARPKLEGAVRVLALGLGRSRVGRERSLTYEDVSGVRRDRITGRTTVYFRQRLEDARGNMVRADLGRKGRGSGLAGRRRADTREVAITMDAAGRPVSLVVLDSDRTGALPPEAAEAAGLLPAAHGAQFVVLEQHLDLTDPANRRAAGAFLARESGAEAVLRDRLREQAVIHVRAYDTDSDRVNGGAGVGVGPIRVGGSSDRTVERARLVGAITRDLGGSWARRADCRA